MALQDWTMLVSVGGKVVGEIPVKKSKVPRRGQKVRIKFGLPEGQVRDGTYIITQVRKGFHDFTIQPAGKLAPRFNGSAD